MSKRVREDSVNVFDSLKKRDGVVCLKGLCLSTLMESMSHTDLQHIQSVLTRTRNKRARMDAFAVFWKMCPGWKALSEIHLSVQGTLVSSIRYKNPNKNKPVTIYLGNHYARWGPRTYPNRKIFLHAPNYDDTQDTWKNEFGEAAHTFANDPKITDNMLRQLWCYMGYRRYHKPFVNFLKSL